MQSDFAVDQAVLRVTGGGLKGRRAPSVHNLPPVQGGRDRSVRGCVKPHHKSKIEPSTPHIIRPLIKKNLLILVLTSHLQAPLLATNRENRPIGAAVARLTQLPPLRQDQALGRRREIVRKINAEGVSIRSAGV